jgi:hypothetical protein
MLRIQPRLALSNRVFLENRIFYISFSSIVFVSIGYILSPKENFMRKIKLYFLALPKKSKKWLEK